jgi:AcrR family transcriptional regulator
MPRVSKPPRKAPATYHHGDLPRALLNAARAEVEKGGPNAVSLTALAKKLGVTQSAPYRHFVDRDAILSAVAVEGFREFIAILKASTSGDDQPSKVSRCARAYVTFGMERHGMYCLLFASSLTPKSQDGSELFNISQESFQVLADAFDPELSPSARARKALRVWVAMHGIVMLAKQGLLRGGVTAASLDRLIEDCIAPPV